MQANPILTAIDKPVSGVKSGKNNSSASTEISFNQMLSKEMSSGKRPELDMVRPAVRPAPPPAPASSAKPNNNVNTNNNSNNNSSGNTLAKNEAANTAPATPQTEKTDASDGSSSVAKEDEGPQKEDDLSDQILALVGNLAPPPVVTDVSKNSAPVATDSSKTVDLAGIPASTVVASSDLTDSSALAALAKSAKDSLSQVDSNAGKQLAAKPEQSDATDTADLKTDVASLATQIMGNKNKADGKPADKISDTTSSKAVTAIEAGKAASLDGNGNANPSSLLPAAPRDASLTQGANTVTKKDDVVTADSKTSEVKTNDLDLGNKVSEKSSDKPAVSSAADKPQSFADDIARARSAMAERMPEVKAGASLKDAAAVINPAPVAQASINPTQFNAAALAVEQIAPRVGNPGWDKAVGQKVVWMVGEGLQSAELTLNPPDLGPLQVVLKVSNDQASASFSSNQPEVREALEASLPRLKQMLSDAGVQLSGFSVNSQAPGQGQSGQGFSQQQTGSNSRISRLGNDAVDNTISTTASSTATPVKVNNGLVDTFV